MFVFRFIYILIKLGLFNKLCVCISSSTAMLIHVLSVCLSVCLFHTARSKMVQFRAVVSKELNHRKPHGLRRPSADELNSQCGHQKRL